MIRGLAIMTVQIESADGDLGLAQYDIELHRHLFAAWAACRAASVKGCRFKVQAGRKILESAGFAAGFCLPDQLPLPDQIDTHHRQWRNLMINAASLHGLTLTHGVAAKLINVYLKCRFVCGGLQKHERVRCLHPPIDDELLKALIQRNVGGLVREWRRARGWRWSKFTSDQYEIVIGLVRQSLKGRPLWMIEEHWKGNQ